MTELYIFNRDDELLTIITEENGLISAPVRDELNEVSDTPFTFTVDARVKYEQSYGYENQLTQVASAFIGVYGIGDVSEKKNVSPAQFVKEGNSVVFKDIEGRLREFIIKELDDSNGIDGAESTATCLPTFIDELSVNYVLDKRYSNSKPQRAMDDIVNGTRFEGVIDGSFGEASTNFYRITSADALFKMRDAWGGDLIDEIELNEYGRISKRKVVLRQRLGADNGLRFEIDHNIEGIERTVISYPKTAMYGYGASLETEGGGNTRYIDFADVEWKKSNGDPVDKPKGQTWVGDPDALNKNGIPKGDGLLHRYGKFSNQDYEDAEELLWATWQSLQKAKEPEVNYKLSVDLLDKKASLGDTAIAIDREFARPIEIQTRIIAIEYDLVDIENTTDVEMGQFLNLRDDRLDKIEDEINNNRGKWEHPTVDNGSFPDIKPKTPENFKSNGLFKIIQLSWDYDDESYIAAYEVYASQVKGFVPQPQHMAWRGKAGGYNHQGDVNQKWYFRLRAVNHHGNASEFTQELEASTLRINADTDIQPETITNKLIAENAAIDFAKIANVEITNAMIHGKLSANKVQIGPETDYDPGYDPSEKETPSGAQEKADKARTDAEKSAKEYANEKDTGLREDLRLTAPLPTSLRLDQDGIRASASGTSRYAQLDYRGVFIKGGAIQIEREDGALWVENGMVKKDYDIAGQDPHFMGIAIGESGEYDAFQTLGGYYRGRTSELDGSGYGGQDIRESDKGYTVNVQRYWFLHSARYFVLRFQPSVRTNGIEKMRVRLYEGDDQLIGQNIEETDYGSWHPLIVDLGTPTYKEKRIDLKVGFLRQWKKSSAEGIAFRISRTYLTDFK